MKNKRNRMSAAITVDEDQRLLTHTRGQHKFTEKEKAKMDAFQSLDFVVNENQIYHEYNRKNTKLDYFTEQFGKWVISLWIGITVGIFAYCIKKAVEHLSLYKFDIPTEHFLKHPETRNLLYAYLSYSGMSAALAVSSCLVILIVRQPLAGGSGLPEVKGYLNGVRIPNSLNVKTLFGKVISLILSFSSGLILGPEGPMIHIGSMIGAALGQVKSKTLRWYPRVFWRFHNDRDRRDFISSGAAAGVAAAFGAPIGGILFSLEEASSFWSPQLTWRTFLTCLFATFTASMLHQPTMRVSQSGMLAFGMSHGGFLYQVPEISAFAVLGVIGGLMGSLFVFTNVRLNHWRKAKLHHPGWRVLEVFLVVMITTGAVFGLSLIGPCRKLPATFDLNERSSLVNMMCDDGTFSEIGTLLYNQPDTALRMLYMRLIPLHEDDRSDLELFSVESLGISCVLFFLLTLLTSGLLLAGGLFIPMMLIGATLGRFVGRFLQMGLGNYNIDPSVYALVGTASVMGGFSRMTISLVVILVELTQGTQYLVPIILAVMVSKWVGDIYTEAHYENLMEIKCIPYLHTDPPQAMLFLSACDVMHTNPVCLPVVVRVSEMVKSLKNNKHGGFPVIEKGPQGQKYLRGLILRNQLLVLLSDKIFTNVYDDNGDNNGNNQNIGSGQFYTTMCCSTITYEEFTERLAKRLPDVDEIDLNESDLDMFIDLGPYMNTSVYSVHETCSYTEAYRIFRTMGLRHLVVIDKHNEVIGIITRKDLL